MTERQDEAGRRAFEIAYAMFRVADRAANVPMKQALERLAVRIIESASTGAYAELHSALLGMEYLVHLGASVNVIHAENAETLLHAKSDLDAAIEELERRSLSPIHLDDILLTRKDVQGKQGEAVKPEVALNNHDPAIRQRREPNSLKSSNERQALISQRIRQSETCRLRDIQDLLPDVSERTIRYDIEYLIAHGVIERFGSGGPATYYRPKQGLETAPTA